MTNSVIDTLTVVDQLVASQMRRQSQPSSAAFRDGIVRNADAFHRTPNPAWALFSGLTLVRYIGRGADLNEPLTSQEQALVATFHRHITDLEDWTTRKWPQRSINGARVMVSSPIRCAPFLSTPQ